MKKVLLAAVVFLGLMSCTNAQEGNSGETGSGRQRDLSSMIDSRVADLTERLSLTASQVDQVRAIYEKTMGAISAPQDDSGAAGGEQAISSTEQRHNEIMDLLNDDQKEIYAAYLKDRESLYQRGNATGTTERPQMNSESIIDSRVADLTERLSLTSQQVEQVRAIYEDTLGSESATSADDRHNRIMDLLDAKQKEIYSTYLNEREQRTPRRAAPANQQL